MVARSAQSRGQKLVGLISRRLGEALTQGSIHDTRHHRDNSTASRAKGTKVRGDAQVSRHVAQGKQG